MIYVNLRRFLHFKKEKLLCDFPLEKTTVPNQYEHDINRVD